MNHGENNGKGVLIPILKGGLGNQMFIYATAKAIAVEKGLDLKIDIESGFKNDYKYRRSFSLQGFQLNVPYASKAERLWRPLDWKRRYLKYGGSRLSFGNELLIEENSSAFNPGLVAKVPRYGRIYLNGYFQSERYFAEIRPEVYRDFGFQEQRKLEELCSSVIGDPSQTTCIHVRVFNDHPDEHQRLRSYYARALDTLRDLDKADRIVVISENVCSAREVIDTTSPNVIFVESEGRSELEDFYVLSSCRNIVIAESTFSWWAAWVGEQRYDDRVVIAPGFRKEGGTSSWGFSDLIPDRWQRI